MNKDDILKENCFPSIPSKLGKIKYCKRSKNGEHEFIEKRRFFYGMKRIGVGYSFIEKEEYDKLSLNKKREILHPHWGITLKCKKCGKIKYDIEDL